VADGETWSKVRIDEADRRVQPAGGFDLAVESQPGTDATAHRVGQIVDSGAQVESSAAAWQEAQQYQ
jgi:hypothetical protein